MNKYSNLITPLLFLIFLVIFVSFIKPFLIIDETRYIGVAWEMYNSGNLLVPHLNGIAYDHKPPLLFWLINLDWNIFGLNTFSLRFIPLIFAIGVIVLNYKIYKLLWSKDKRGLSYIAWISVSLIVISFYTTLFMFDIMLSFWVLLAIYGGLKAINGEKNGYFLIAIAIAFGILAKSPVVILHLLALYIFAFYWAKNRVNKNFYIYALLAVIVGVIIALFWMVPAAIEGGKEFAKGIFWEQYAGRAVDAFAHKRAFWWYIPWIFVILIPWIFYKGFFIGLQRVYKDYFDEGIKFLFVWIVGTLFIFSLISGKQLHYIAPEFAAFALLITRTLSIYKNDFYSIRVFGVILTLIGISFLITPFFIKGYLIEFLDKKAFFISGVILLILGIYIFVTKFKNQLNLIKIVSISSILFVALIYYNAHIFLAKQDLENFSKEVAKIQNRGFEVAHIGKYHNQYQYFGRLKKPIKILWSNKEIKDFIKKNPNGAIILYKKRKEYFNKNLVITTTKFRTQNAILIKASNFKDLSKK